MECAGEVLVSCLVLIFSDFNPQGISVWEIWLLAFLCLSIYGRNPFLLATVIVRGIGHIGIHLCHRKEVSEDVDSI